MLREKLVTAVLMGMAGMSAGCGGDGEQHAAQAARASAGRRVAAKVTAEADARANAFHALYYDAAESTWQSTFWQGVRVRKIPLDLWIYQEILHSLRPDLIIETGTDCGGSALYLAQLCDLAGRGGIVTIDIAGDEVTDAWRQPGQQGGRGRPAHPRIRYLTGSSTAPEVFAQAKQAADAHATVMVILDSDHSMQHVLAEMRLYADLVSPGSYLIVEDTNVGGHPVAPDFGPGPMEAVDAFLRERDDFSIDATREKFRVTFNPRGYLKKTGNAPAGAP